MTNEFTKMYILVLLPPDFEPVMELAGRLALERHEGRPIKFAFLVGTDAVWPAIAEVLSADFGLSDDGLYTEEKLADPKLYLKLMETICKSNYSIFQIFGAAGFYNTGLGRFVNIIRLIQPLKGELSREEKVVDLDDLFCFAVGKIHKEKACIVSTEGDGRVRVYAVEEEGNKYGDLLFVWNVTNGEISRPIPPKVEEAIKEFLDNHNGSSALLKVIRKVSTTVGEGAMLILARNSNAVSKFLATMEYFTPEWQRNLNLTVPKELLKAAFVMDGSTLISKAPNVKIKPRYAVYPFKGDQAYSLLRDLEVFFKKDNEKKCSIVEKLSGKGSKTHVAANLAHLLEEKRIKIITISADGPISLWPDEFKKDES